MAYAKLKLQALRIRATKMGIQAIRKSNTEANTERGVE